MKKEIGGTKIGRWTVIAEGGHNKHGQLLWLCRCECGVERTVVSLSLHQGKSLSCGCFNRERTSAVARVLHTTHGHARTNAKSPTYLSWRAMKLRCLDTRTNGYHRYGGRGITVCARWLVFENFLIDMGERPEGLTLDRIDPNGDYEPNNCCWSTPSHQRRNQRQKVAA